MQRREDPAVRPKVGVLHMRALDGIRHPERDAAEVLVAQHQSVLGAGLAQPVPEYILSSVLSEHPFGQPSGKPVRLRFLKEAGTHRIGAVSSALPGSVISPFVEEWLPRVVAAMGIDSESRCALDLAMGEGRHAVSLAQAGFQTFGVDRSVDRLLTARRMARERRVSLMQWAADLDSYPLPAGRFDLLCCTRFLLRARWGDLKHCVRPGGFVMYETFTIEQIALGWGPSSPEHLLLPGELAAAFSDWDILFSEEIGSPEAMARIVARKPRDVPH